MPIFDPPYSWPYGRNVVEDPSMEARIIFSPSLAVLAPIRDQENRIRVAIDDLVEFLNVMGAD